MNINTSDLCVLVCVTDQDSNERLIRAGHAIAEQAGYGLHVLSVLPRGTVSEGMADFMQKLYDTAGVKGAQITFIFNSDPALTAAVHAAKINAAHIVSGTPDVGGGLFLETVKSLMPQIPLSIVDADEQLYTFPPMPSHHAMAVTAKV